MTSYSPVAPITILQQLQQEDLLGNYLLLLAHDVVKHALEYRQLVDGIRNQYNQSTIIMDNGVIENGKPVELEMLLEAAGIVEADVVVGPDVIAEAEITQDLLLDQAPDILANYDIMIVPQGGTILEVCDAVNWMHDNIPDIGTRWWGVPRWMTNEFGTRAGVLNYINNYARGDHPIKIHLLGMSKNFDDDVKCAKSLSVRGIDSANPLVLGRHDFYMNVGAIPHKSREDYWECTYLSEAMKANVSYVQHAINL